MKTNLRKKIILIILIFLSAMFFLLIYIPDFEEIINSKNNIPCEFAMKILGIIGSAFFTLLSFLLMLIDGIISAKKQIIIKKCIESLYVPFDCENISNKIYKSIVEDKKQLVIVNTDDSNENYKQNLKSKLYLSLSSKKDIHEVRYPSYFSLEELNLIYFETCLNAKKNKYSIIICDNKTAHEFEIRNLINFEAISKKNFKRNRIAIIYIK